MAFILESLRQDIVDYLESQIPQDVYRGGVPEPGNLLYNSNGQLIPYVVVGFGDMAQGGSRSIVGARGDSYYFLVNVFCIASDIGTTSGSTIAERIQANVIDKLLGYKPTNAGQLNKVPGGSSFVMVNEQGKPNAYIAVASFRVFMNVIEVP